MSTSKVVSSILLLSFTAGVAVSQDAESDTEQPPLVIGAIDFYGLQRISEADVRDLLPFSEGALGGPGRELWSEELGIEIAAALGVPRVKMSGVCCMDVGQAIVFIGVEETPAATLAYHDPPTGEIELPEEILQLESEADEAIGEAFRNASANLREDISAGHSLVLDPRTRAIQERFVDYAEKHWETLIQVLKISSRPQDRAIAARFVAYAGDKAAIVPHLEHAILDSGVGVRNNATRALAIIATYANDHPELAIEIRPEMFIDMLNSIEWSDRNKAGWMLQILTEDREPDLMGQLRTRALPSLIEMCNWKSEGHAFSSCIMLERILGLPEQDELHPTGRTIAMARELLQ